MSEPNLPTFLRAPAPRDPASVRAYVREARGGILGPAIGVAALSVLVVGAIIVGNLRHGDDPSGLVFTMVLMIGILSLTFGFAASSSRRAIELVLAVGQVHRGEIIGHRISTAYRAGSAMVRIVETGYARTEAQIDLPAGARGRIGRGAQVLVVIAGKRAVLLTETATGRPAAYVGRLIG